MARAERRRYKRMPARLPVTCRKIGSGTQKPFSGHTVNVCPGGVYFESDSDVFETDNLVKVGLTIPPSDGLLEHGGRIAGFAKVLRVEPLHGSSGHSRVKKYGVAVEFCKSPRLCT